MNFVAKKRLDQLVVEYGIAESREKAKALIMAGQGYADNQKADKPGTTYGDDVKIELRGNKLKYVSRGGLKLEKAMTAFGLKLDGRITMDVGDGISMKVFSENQSIDLISNLGESLEEKWAGAKKGFFYQMAACDINGDGEKEIIIAGGNKKDVLELCVLQVKKNLELGYGEEEEENPQLIKSINGGYKAYLNDKRKICVIK